MMARAIIVISWQNVLFQHTLLIGKELKFQSMLHPQVVALLI